ncbi:MAG TPA: hypothetical protein VN840_07750 [Streptosporangiaceae bacterium]|nr:hypothetical protein [Streptosporangiaceae bacterium]
MTTSTPSADSFSIARLAGRADAWLPDTKVLSQPQTTAAKQRSGDAPPAEVPPAEVPPAEVPAAEVPAAEVPPAEVPADRDRPEYCSDPGRT